MNYTEQLLNFTAVTTAATNMSTTMSTTTTTRAARVYGKQCTPGEEHVVVTIAPAILRIFSIRDSWFDVKKIPPEDVILKITFYVLVMLVDMIGNGLVIFLVSVSKKMRTPTNVLLVNLAVADLLICLLCMWVHLGDSITPEWPFNLAICKVNMFAQVTMITSSVLTLTVISIERFFAIVFPLKRTWTLRLTIFFIVAIWVIACSIASPQLHVRYLQEYEFSDHHVIICKEKWPEIYLNKECDTWTPTKRVYHLFVAVVMFFVPIVVMIVSYTVICVCLLTRKAPGSSSSNQSSSKKRVVRMLVVLLVVFVVCWTPTHALELVSLFSTDTKEVTDTVSYTALYIGYLNSALNPVLYAGFNENFRKGFQEIFKCGCLSFNKTSRVRPQELRPAPSTDARSRFPASSVAAVRAPECQQRPQQPMASASKASTVGNDGIKDSLPVHTATTSFATSSFNGT